MIGGSLTIDGSEPLIINETLLGIIYVGGLGILEGIEGKLGDLDVSNGTVGMLLFETDLLIASIVLLTERGASAIIGLLGVTILGIPNEVIGKLSDGLKAIGDGV